MDRTCVGNISLLAVCMTCTVGLGADKAPDGRKEVVKKLGQMVDFPGMDPNTPLKDGLDLLTKTYTLKFHLDKAGFRKMGIMDPENLPVQFPVVKKMRLHRVTGRRTVERLRAWLLSRGGRNDRDWADANAAAIQARDRSAGTDAHS
jgi:hypothetical protein